jgi:hypothetical protein
MADPQHPRLRDKIRPPLLLMRCQICGVTATVDVDDDPVTALDHGVEEFKGHLDAAHDGWRDGAYASWGVP